jgi:hypothetical protein
MKTRTHLCRVPPATALCFAMAVWMSPQAMDIGRPYADFSIEKPKEEKPAKKKGTKSASYASRNNQSVRIYPDVLKREMHVVAKYNDGREVEFFVFDLEGMLVRHEKLSPKEKLTLSDLERGKYRYNVFCGDEETAAGTFEIR